MDCCFCVSVCASLLSCPEVSSSFWWYFLLFYHFWSSVHVCFSPFISIPLPYRVEDIMKRSYSELDSMKHEVDRQQQLDSINQQTLSMEELSCSVCSSDIDQYYSCAARITTLQTSMKVHPQYMYILHVQWKNLINVDLWMRNNFIFRILMVVPNAAFAC